MSDDRWRYVQRDGLNVERQLLQKITDHAFDQVFVRAEIEVILSHTVFELIERIEAAMRSSLAQTKMEEILGPLVLSRTPSAGDPATMAELDHGLEVRRLCGSPCRRK